MGLEVGVTRFVYRFPIALNSKNETFQRRLFVFSKVMSITLRHLAIKLLKLTD